MGYFGEKDVIQLCIEKLARIYGSSVQIQHVRSVGGGCINNASKLETNAGDFFLKWNASAPSGMFEKEAAGLSEMSSSGTSLIIPRVIFYSAEDDSPKLILLEYLSPANNNKGYDELLGRGIAEMHRKNAARFGFRHSNYCGTTLQDNLWTDSWPEFYAHRRIGGLLHQIQKTRKISTDELRVYEKLIDRMPLLVSNDSIPSLIHGDLWSGNYMFTANGPALIDPACYYADREMELGMMKLFGGFSPTVWQSYQEEFPLQSGWMERIALYQLYHVLNHYLLFGGSYGRQAIEIAQTYL